MDLKQTITPAVARDYRTVLWPACAAALLHSWPVAAYRLFAPDYDCLDCPSYATHRARRYYSRCAGRLCLTAMCAHFGPVRLRTKSAEHFWICGLTADS